MRRQGFTLVEVMVSIGVMTIGAMAVLAMQQQLIRANMHARELTTATQIAQNWIERLKLDGVRWNNLTDLGDTTYLRTVPVPGTQGAFTALPAFPYTAGATTRILSNAFDYYGNDLDTAGGTPAGLHYCASYRLNWVYNNQRAMRADVRVWWSRDGVGNITADFPLCADDNAALNPPAGARFNNYHIVYLSTVLKATPI